MSKRGSKELTVGKMINAILFFVILALVLYGISINGFNPLIDRFNSEFDKVLILLHLKNDISFENCYSEKIANLAGGEEFSKRLGLSGSDISLNICRNKACNFSGGLENYRYVDGGFEIFDGSWTKHGLFSRDSLKSVKLEHEIYTEGVSLLKNVGAKSFYDKGFTRRFVLYGDGSGLIDSPSEAIWFNGIWNVTIDGNINIVIEDDTRDNEAISIFVTGVDDSYDDKVFFREENVFRPDESRVESPYFGESIDNLVGSAGDSGEIDSEEDIKNLKIEFAKIKDKFRNEVAASEEDVNDLISSLSDKKILIDDKVFNVKVENIDEKYPLVVFDSGNEKYGLEFYANAKTHSSLFGSDIKLNYFPVSLVKWDGARWNSAGEEEYYRLSDSYFAEIYKMSLVGDFLEKSCL